MPTDLQAFRERAARAVAKADRGCARGDAIAILASLMPSSRSSLSLPTPLIDAAYEAVRFDEDWAINSPCLVHSLGRIPRRTAAPNIGSIASVAHLLSEPGQPRTPEYLSLRAHRRKVPSSGLSDASDL
jgi:hypothetical protein